MCGISGVIAESAALELYEALNLLQHRGQDAAGIATCDGARFFQRKAAGLVRDVFAERHIERLKGDIGLGHVRYPTVGGDRDPGLIQPIYVNSPYGVLLVHNGNLVNADDLAKRLFEENRRHLNTDSDSEALLNVFASELATANGDMAPSPERIFEAVAGVHRRCRGAYSALALLVGHGLVGFRDPWGIRPLVIGAREGRGRREYMFASESVALDALGFERLRDVAPGEAVFIDMDGRMHARQCAETFALRPCIFEYVYLSRPDSLINGISVYKTRLRQGEYLADKILREGPKDIEVVVPVPDTGRVAAQAIAEKLNMDCREGLMKNRYIGRTFIMPDQKQRDSGVRRKLNAIAHEFEGKNVLLVDDSIVRGTTSKQLVALARQAGARKVYFASCAPPVRYPNVYGIDMPATSEFVAHRRSVEEIAQFIGADALIYQDLADLDRAVRDGLVDDVEIDDFERSVFDGEYVTGGVDDDYLRALAGRRSC